mgnify:CR=1 FL=1
MFVTPDYTAFFAAIVAKCTDEMWASIEVNNPVDNDGSTQSYNIEVYDNDGKAMFGKFVEDVKVLAVKDKNGRHVFENSDETRTPAIIIFAVPEELTIIFPVPLSTVATLSSLLVHITVFSSIFESKLIL